MREPSLHNYLSANTYWQGTGILKLLTQIQEEVKNGKINGPLGSLPKIKNTTVNVIDFIQAPKQRMKQHNQNTEEPIY